MSGYNSPSSPTCGWVLVPEVLASSLQESEMTPSHTQILSEGWEWKQRPDGSDVEVLHDDTGWTRTTVPTEIFRDLLNSGKIDDPHLDRNECDVAWVGKVDWLYRTNFKLSRKIQREKVVLVFEGLDTFAKVYLNGHLILESEVDNAYLD